MVSKIITFGLSGTRAFQVNVETDIQKGIPYFDMVGMASESVKEAKKRVKSAILNQNHVFPKGHITQNLTPADTKKQGTGFDLALAVGILSCSQKFNNYPLENFAVIGELSLTGDVLPVKGIISSIVCGISQGITHFIIPCENAYEALTAPDAYIYPVRNLNDVVELLMSTDDYLNDLGNDTRGDFVGTEKWNENFEYDFQDVYGQDSVKRALLIAAAGKHNIILSGSPGSGKTMMAKCLQSILPPLTYEEYFSVLQIYSNCGLQNQVINKLSPPFRTAHQGITKASLIGGGRPLEIGEMSLAHNGVLFMDELAETPKNILETLRKPLEDRQVSVLNCGVREILPADFLFVGAMNPCPCGNVYEGGNKCTCSLGQIAKYSSKLSGPLLDRIDIKVPVKSVPSNKIGIKSKNKSCELRQIVINAREKQRVRFKNCSHHFNGSLENLSNYKCFDIDKNSKMLLDEASKKMGISVRAYGKIIKVARTIADIDNCEKINDDHILESIQIRESGMLKAAIYE